MTSMQLLAWSQRIGYVLTMLLIGAGWLIGLALLLEWRAAHWSRPALALQAAALVLALLLRQHVPARRLVVYPLLLAASIYLWDTTLPPPSLPQGWPRVLIPSLVLLGLAIDYARTVQHVRHSRQRSTRTHRHPIALDEAARLLGIPVADLRRHIQKRKYAITIDTEGQEYMFLDELHALNDPSKPRWWQLYVWLLLMIGLSVLTMLAAIPAGWETTVQIVWCLLTWGGMVVWVWANRVELRDEDRTKRRVRARAASDAARTLPLTPVQQHFLDVMERRERDSDASDDPFTVD